MAAALRRWPAATMVVKLRAVPTGGYMNLGDTVVLLGGYLLGLPGALVRIGPALADVLGSPIYAPATLVIKAGDGGFGGRVPSGVRKGR